MTCTLGWTCVTGATFIAFTSLCRQPRRGPPGRKADGREIPSDSHFPGRQGIRQEKIPMLGNY